jgi:hypothetical protein
MDPLPDELKDAAKADKKDAAKGNKEKSPEKAGYDSAIEALKKAHEESGKALDDLARLKKGEVGGEKDVKLTPDEKAKTEKLEEKIEDEVVASHVLKLAGSLEDQLDALEEFRDRVLIPDQDKMSKKDLELYHKLYKVGSTQDPKTGKYSKINDLENARLRKIEGPLITREVIAKMAAGEISWSANGAWAAQNLLRAGRLPSTGKRPAAGTAEAGAKTDAGAGADVINMKTGKKMTGVEIAAAAVLAGGAIVDALSGDRSPDAAPADAERAKADYDAAVAELEQLLDEINGFDDDSAVFRELADHPAGAELMKALEDDSPIIAKYLRLSDTSASLEEIKAIFPGISDSEAEDFKKLASRIDDDFYRKHVIEPMFALTGDDRIKAFVTAFNRAKNQEQAMRSKVAERAAALEAKIAGLEKGLVDAGHVAPDHFLNRDISASEARLANIKARRKELTDTIEKKMRIAPMTPEIEDELTDLLHERTKQEEEERKETAILEELVARREKVRAKAKTDDDDRAYADYAGGSNDEHDREEAETAALEKEFPPGTAVKVVRGDKTVEDGWQVSEVKDGEALVIKHDEEYETNHPGKIRMLRKHVPLRKLKEWQTSKSETTGKTEVKGEADELLDKAKALLEKDGEISHHSVMVTLKVGYNRADAILARLEKDGLIDPKVGAAPQKKTTAKNPVSPSAGGAPAASEPREPLDFNSRVAADIFEGAKTEHPDIDQREVVKEARGDVRDILAARKSFYIAGIEDGTVTLEELNELKSRLTGGEPETAVRNVLTSSKEKSLRLSKRSLKAVETFMTEIFHDIIEDTDDLIALAEKTSASSSIETRLDAEPKKFEIRSEVKELMDRIAVKIAKRRKNILLIIDSAYQSKDRSNELLEGIIESEKAVAEEFSSNKHSELRRSLAELDYFTDEESEHLKEIEIITISEQLVRDAEFAIDSAREKLYALAKTKATEPKPAKPDAKSEREAITKIMAEARNKIKTIAGELDKKETGELENTEDELKNIEPKDLKERLVKDGLIAAEQAEKLSRDGLFMIRYELVAAYKKAIDEKNGAKTEPAVKAAESRAIPGEKEPKKKTEYDQLVDKAKAALETLKTEGLARVGELDNDNDLVRAIEQLNRTIDRFDIKKGVTKEQLIGRLAELEVLPKDELEKLNEHRLKNLAIVRIDQLTAVKEEAKKRRVDLAANPPGAPAAKTGVNRGRLAGSPEPTPSDSSGGEKEPTAPAIEQAELILQTRGESMLAGAGSNDVETLGATRNAVETADTAALKAYLVDSGITQAQVDVLNDQNLEILRGIETTNLLEAFDRAKKLRKKELTEINRVMGQKKLVKGFSQISDPLKLDPESLRELSSLVEQATPGDKTAIELIKALLEKVRAKK